MIPGLLVPAAKPFAYIALLVYLLIEHRRRGRSWEEIGIRVRSFKRDFLHNWHLFLLVAVLLQLPAPLVVLLPLWLLSLSIMAEGFPRPPISIQLAIASL
jgi:hypothetical protein